MPAQSTTDRTAVKVRWVQLLMAGFTVELVERVTGTNTPINSIIVFAVCK